MLTCCDFSSVHAALTSQNLNSETVRCYSGVIILMMSLEIGKVDLMLQCLNQLNQFIHVVSAAEMEHWSTNILLTCRGPEQLRDAPVKITKDRRHHSTAYGVDVPPIPKRAHWSIVGP